MSCLWKCVYSNVREIKCVLRGHTPFEMANVQRVAENEELDLVERVRPLRVKNRELGILEGPAPPKLKKTY
jgi:hypothetical protein